MSDYQFIGWDERGPVVVLRLLEPTGEFGDTLHPIHEEITNALEEVGRSQRWEAVVLTGEDKTFYTGPPLENLVNVLRNQPEEVEIMIRDARRIVRALTDLDKPLIAAVNGPAVGLGAQLALFSDFILAEPEAFFQDTHVRVGLPAGDGGVVAWPLVLGLARAKRLLLTGRKLTAEEADRWGLLEQVAPRDELLERAVMLAQRLTGDTGHAVRLTKRALNEWLKLGESTAFEQALMAERAEMYRPSLLRRLSDLLERQTRSR